MAGQGLLRRVQLSDPTLARFQSNVNDAVEALAAAGNRLALPVATFTGGGSIALGAPVAVFAGPAGQTLFLPPAAAAGAQRAAVVLVMNASANAVALRPVGSDTLNGSGTAALTVATQTVAQLVSDGAARWVRVA